MTQDDDDIAQIRALSRENKRLSEELSAFRGCAADASKTLSAENKKLRAELAEHDCGLAAPARCGGCCECMAMTFPNWEAIEAEVKKLREERDGARRERDLFAVAGEAAELRIVQLREELEQTKVMLKMEHQHYTNLNAQYSGLVERHYDLRARAWSDRATIERVEAVTLLLERDKAVSAVVLDELRAALRGKP